jgi:hypothetical protein
MGNVDGWGFAFIVFGTAAITAMLPAQTPRGAASVDTAARSALAQPVDPGVSYKIVVERPRLPVECKSVTAETSADVIDNCQRIASQDASEIMLPQSQFAQGQKGTTNILRQPGQIGQ